MSASWRNLGARIARLASRLPSNKPSDGDVVRAFLHLDEPDRAPRQCGADLEALPQSRLRDEFLDSMDEHGNFRPRLDSIPWEPPVDLTTNEPRSESSHAK